jgi:plasmid maintenance system antidote protein VapI
MFDKLSILKGVHPGKFLERELKKRGLRKGQFALSIGEYPQTLGAVILGRRAINPAMAVKIEEYLGLEEGFLMCLQGIHDTKIHKLSRQRAAPDLSQLRPVLFWDTDINTIDWQKNKRAVLKRVMERGNEKEKAEIDRFYHQKNQFA